MIWQFFLLNLQMWGQLAHMWMGFKHLRILVCPWKQNAAKQLQSLAQKVILKRFPTFSYHVLQTNYEWQWRKFGTDLPQHYHHPSPGEQKIM